MIGFIRQYGRLIVGRGGSAILQAITLIALARFSDIADFGVYATGVAVGAICIGVFGMGLPTLVLRSEARAQTGLAGSALLLGAAGSALAAGAVASIMFVLAPGSDVALRVAAAIFTASELWMNLVQNILLGVHLEGRATAVIVARRALPLAGVLLFAFSAENVYLGLSIGSAVVCVLGLTTIWSFRDRKKSLINVWKEARHFWLANVASMLQQLDVVFIRQGLGNAQAAAYSAAFRLASPVHIVTTAITSKMVPALSAEGDSRAKRIRQRRYLFTGLGYGAIIFLLAPVAGVLGPLVLGQQYAPWAWLFPLTFVNSALSVVNQIQAAVLYADGKSREVARVTVVSVIVGLSVVGIASAIGSFVMAISGTILIQLILIVFLAIYTRRAFK